MAGHVQYVIVSHRTRQHLLLKYPPREGRNASVRTRQSSYGASRLGLASPRIILEVATP